MCCRTASRLMRCGRRQAGELEVGVDVSLPPTPSPPRMSRTRSTSTTSSASASASGPSISSPLARRPRPGPLSLSARNTPGGSSSPSASSYSYSLRSLKSPSAPPSPLYGAYSASGSTAGGSQLTSATTQPGGVTRFRRGHTRRKDQPVGVRSAHPDELDFATLEDPDEVFRLFGVRDVRGLEKRAA